MIGPGGHDARTDIKPQLSRQTVDYGRLAAARGTVQEVAATKGDPSVIVPISALEELARIVEKEVLNAGIKYDGVEGPLGARRNAPPQIPAARRRQTLYRSWRGWIFSLLRRKYRDMVVLLSQESALRFKQKSVQHRVRASEDT